MKKKDKSLEFLTKIWKENLSRYTKFRYMARLVLHRTGQSCYIDRLPQKPYAKHLMKPMLCFHPKYKITTHRVFVKSKSFVNKA